MFVATLASVILYMMFTYSVRLALITPTAITIFNFQLVFAIDVSFSSFELLVTVVCSSILITDVASTILHLSWTTIASRRDITSQNKGNVSR